MSRGMKKSFDYTFGMIGVILVMIGMILVLNFSQAHKTNTNLEGICFIVGMSTYFIGFALLSIACISDAMKNNNP